MTTLPISLKSGRTKAEARCTSSLIAPIPVFIRYLPKDSLNVTFVQKKSGFPCFPRLARVPFNLLLQRGHGGKFLFVAQFFEERQFEFPTIDVADEIQQVRFHLHR